MRKKDDTYQQRTIRIAEKAGMQKDLLMYSDPMKQSQMYGNFLHALYTSKKHPYLKILFSMFFLLIPTFILDVFFTQKAFFAHQNIHVNEDKIGLLFYYPLSIIIYFIAIKLIIKAMRVLFDSSPKKAK